MVNDLSIYKLNVLLAPFELTAHDSPLTFENPMVTSLERNNKTYTYKWKF